MDISVTTDVKRYPLVEIKPTDVNLNVSELKSLDEKISTFISDLSKSEKLTNNDLRKTSAIFTLNKLKVGMVCVERLQTLLTIQRIIESKVFDPEIISQLSLQELVGMMKLVNSRIDNYYYKVNDVLGGVDLPELENLLMIISEQDKKNSITTQLTGEDSERDESATRLSLKLLKEFSTLEKNREGSC